MTTVAQRHLPILEDKKQTCLKELMKIESPTNKSLHCLLSDGAAWQSVDDFSLQTRGFFGS